MYKIFLAASMLVGVQSFYAQTKLNPPVNSGELMLKADSLSDEEAYAEAIQLVEQIDRGDTNYLDALLQISLLYGKNEQYEKAFAACDEGMNATRTPYYAQFWLNKGYIHDLKEEYDEAIAIYKELDSLYPLYSSAKNNLAYEYMQADKFDKSYETYKEYTKLYPFSSIGHFNLGAYAFHQGHITEAFMALNMVILLDPYSDRALSVLLWLNELANNTKLDREPKEGFKLESEEFKEIDLLIENYVALTKKYKVKTKSKLYLAKQNHLLLSQLVNMESSDYFFNEFYVPFYKKLWNQGYYEEMQLFELIPSKNATHKALVTKKMPVLKAFYSWVRKTWNEQNKFHQIDFDSFHAEYELFYSNSGLIESIGHKNKVTGYYDGEIIYMYTDGTIKSKGAYKDGKETGWWKFYGENNLLSGKVKYIDGKVTDTVYLYYDNGMLKNKIAYTDNEKEGGFTDYFSNGRQYRIGSYKAGKFDGPMKYYFKHPVLEYDASYKAGELDGILKEYFATGELYRQETYIDGKSVGKYEVFWSDGTKRRVGRKDGDGLEGIYEGYFQNGKLDFKGNYADGEREGLLVDYYSDGTLSSERNYTDGKLNGKTNLYDYEGKLYAEKEYAKGKLISFKYMDKSGGVLSEGGSKKSQFHIKQFDQNRNLSSEGDYNPKVGEVGTWKEYNDYGALTEEYNYEDGELSGKYTVYYSTGEVKKELNYNEGEVDGYWVEFYVNGNIKRQGYYTEGETVGLWEGFFIDGAKSWSNFTQNEEIEGVEVDYAVNGRVRDEETYEGGVLTKVVFYDSSENKMSESILPGGDGEYKRPRVNGKEEFSGNYILGVANGKFLWKYANGKTSVEGKYLNGSRVEPWVWYYDNGQISSRGEYVSGKKHGVWKRYYKNGQEKEVETFYHGDLVDSSIAYFENGKQKDYIEYKWGYYHGEYKFFDPNGVFQMARYYNLGEIIGYYYLDASGNKVETMFDDGTAEVEAKFKNGKVSRKFTLKQGDFLGSYKSYYESGAVHLDYNLDKGYRHGSYKVFYENGNLKTSFNYEYGNLKGPSKEYYESGKLKSEYFYVNDVKHGDEVQYNENGTVKATIKHYDGDEL